jgi:hypothetical protein
MAFLILISCRRDLYLYLMNLNDSNLTAAMGRSGDCNNYSLKYLSPVYCTNAHTSSLGSSQEPETSQAQQGPSI